MSGGGGSDLDLFLGFQQLLLLTLHSFLNDFFTGRFPDLVTLYLHRVHGFKGVIRRKKLIFEFHFQHVKNGRYGTVNGRNWVELA